MYQKLSEFVEKPFGKHQGLNLEYKAKYDKYRNTNRIKLVGVSQIDKAYFAHIVIPSESSNTHYDVVIEFFPDEPSLTKEHTLMNYKCKFFSNSPSFIYRYAALFKKNGYLIEELYEKLDLDYVDKMPEKTNPNNDLCYDKSLFFASRYLLDHYITMLSKVGLILRRKSFDDFAKSVKDYNYVKDTLNVKDNRKPKINNSKKKAILITDKFNPLKRLNLHKGAKIVKAKKANAKITPNKKVTAVKAKKKTSGLK